ncbi:hypothetical protein RHMOL_Rhmol07G0181600 [Rhododendron molle]|uniref:Uncharacterized protein n=1 Tax=Rhododendron molle TaxID=49168 RepID=A0ACC0N366_RHOML|nr:hypothetical protein RHMOL_Rhmol07G0181600 [Rhododendron molle]
MLGYNRGFDDLGVESEDERRTLVEIPSLVPAEAEEVEPNTEEQIANPIEAMNEQAPQDSQPPLPTVTPPLEAKDFSNLFVLCFEI